MYMKGWPAIYWSTILYHLHAHNTHNKVFRYTQESITYTELTWKTVFGDGM